MQRTALSLLLVLVAAPALASGPAPLATGPTSDLAGVESCATGVPDPLETGLGDVTSLADCSARCESGSEISCPSGTTSCSAQDMDCHTGQAGYVTCDGNTTYCGTAKRWFQTSSCCYGLYLWKEQACGASTGWYWQDTGYTDCLLACDGSGLP